MASFMTSVVPAFLALLLAGLPSASPHVQGSPMKSSSGEDGLWQGLSSGEDVVASAMAAAGLGEEEVPAPRERPMEQQLLAHEEAPSPSQKRRGFLDHAARVAAHTVRDAGMELAPLLTSAPSAASMPEAVRQTTGLVTHDILPSVDDIRNQNRLTGCVTIENPLATSSLVKRVAPIGTPCLFRADAWDEASHCMGVEDGRYGQYGWCWTKLDRTEWGSCSRSCPMAGEYRSLSKRLEELEGLVNALTDMAEAKATER